MGLRAAHRVDRPAIHRGIGRLIAVLVIAPVGPDIVYRRSARAGGAGRIGNRVGMHGYLGGRYRNRFRAGELTKDVIVQARPLALMDRQPTAQVGKGKGRLPIASVGRAQEGKKGVILTDRQDRSIAKRPVYRSEIAGKDSDLTNIRIAHCFGWSFIT